MRKTVLFLGAAAAAVIATLPMAAMSRGGEMGPGAGMGLMPSGPVKRSELEAKIKERFAKADTNRDGFVDRAEMQANREAMREDLRARRFAALDTNKDGSVSREEFGKAPAPGARDGMRPGMRGAMRGGPGRMGGGKGGAGGGAGRDTNSDGKVSLAEVLARPLARFDAVDANKDGTVTPEERTAARAQLRALRGI